MAQADASIKAIAGVSTADELAKLQQLKDAGTITQTGYDSLKAQRVMAGCVAMSTPRSRRLAHRCRPRDRPGGRLVSRRLRRPAQRRARQQSVRRHGDPCAMVSWATLADGSDDDRRSRFVAASRLGPGAPPSGSSSARASSVRSASSTLAAPIVRSSGSPGAGGAEQSEPLTWHRAHTALRLARRSAQTRIRDPRGRSRRLVGGDRTADGRVRWIDPSCRRSMTTRR